MYHLQWWSAVCVLTLEDQSGCVEEADSDRRCRLHLDAATHFCYCFWACSWRCSSIWIHSDEWIQGCIKEVRRKRIVLGALTCKQWGQSCHLDVLDDDNYWFVFIEETNHQGIRAPCVTCCYSVILLNNIDEFTCAPPLILFFLPHFRFHRINRHMIEDFILKNINDVFQVKIMQYQEFENTCSSNKYNLWFTSQIMLYKYILLHYYHNTFTSVLKLAYLACHRAIKFYQTILAGTNASHNSRACMEFQREHTKPGMLVGFTRTLSIALLPKAFSPPVI